MKRLQTKVLLKALSPQVVMKVIESFDRITTLVVGLCWAAAALMLGFALYTVNLSVAVKHQAEMALAAEPFLPAIVRKPVDARDVQAMLERLQHRYPDIAFSFRNALSVATGDGTKFHEWLTAIDYIDTISPQFQWVLQELCVGKCTGHDLMGATLAGEKISFEKLHPDAKN